MKKSMAGQGAAGALLLDEAFQPLGYFHEVYQFLASGYVLVSVQKAILRTV
ncbi:hypothetical protein U0O74_003848 [Salmonella enterica]|nr:hypothetical protein [Salmonella enterica]